MDIVGFLLALFFIFFAYETSNRLKRIEEAVAALRPDVNRDKLKATTKENKQ